MQRKTVTKAYATKQRGYRRKEKQKFREVLHDISCLIFKGTYKPRLRCYDVNQLSMKFERGLDAEVIKFMFLEEDYSKVCVCVCVCVCVYVTARVCVCVCVCACVWEREREREDVYGVCVREDFCIKRNTLDFLFETMFCTAATSNK